MKATEAFYMPYFILMLCFISGIYKNEMIVYTVDT